MIKLKVKVWQLTTSETEAYIEAFGLLTSSNKLTSSELALDSRGTRGGGDGDLITLLDIGGAKVKDQAASVERAGTGVGIVTLLVGVNADLVGAAGELDTSADTSSVAVGGELDSLGVVRRTSKTGSAAVNVAKIPVDVVGQGVLDLDDTTLASLANLDTDTGTSTDEVPSLATTVDGNDERSRATVSISTGIAAGVLGEHDGGIGITAPVVDDNVGRSHGGQSSVKESLGNHFECW